MTAAPWWKGARGEWYLIAQAATIALVFLGPRQLGGWPGRPFPLPTLFRVAGAGLMVLGGLLLLAALVRLGSGLTPLPYPKHGSTLVRTGPYAWVRHPMYSGGLLIACGWTLFVGSPLTLGFTLLLFVVLDLKSRREEEWLKERFPDYGDYQRRVRKLIPFLY